jgi:branched-chain amino acid transport system permease protein
MNGALLVQTVIDGLILGGIFSISAVGFSLIFGVLGVVNLSHGMFVLLGAYAALVLKRQFGIDPLFSLFLSFIVLFVIGILLEVFLLSGVMRRGNLMTTLLITFGASLILKDLVVLLIGPDIHTLDSTWTLPTFHVGSVVIDGSRATGLVASLMLLALVSIVLANFKIGRAIRATAQQTFAASLCGVDPRKIYALTFGVSAGFAGASGVIVGIINPFSPADDAFWTLNAFVTVVLGGIGNPLGSLVGGLILGQISTFSSQYIGSVFPNIFMFCALLLMLLWRPHGLLGRPFRGSV